MEKETLDKFSNFQSKNREDYLQFYTTEIAKDVKKVRHHVLLINQLFSLQNRKRRYFVLERDQKIVFFRLTEHAQEKAAFGSRV